MVHRVEMEGRIDAAVRAKYFEIIAEVFDCKQRAREDAAPGAGKGGNAPEGGRNAACVPRGPQGCGGPQDGGRNGELAANGAAGGGGSGVRGGAAAGGDEVRDIPAGESGAGMADR